MVQSRCASVGNEFISNRIISTYWNREAFILVPLIVRNGIICEVPQSQSIGNGTSFAINAHDSINNNTIISDAESAGIIFDHSIIGKVCIMRASESGANPTVIGEGSLICIQFHIGQ